MIKQPYIPPTEVREDPAELANVRAKAPFRFGSSGHRPSVYLELGDMKEMGNK